MTARWGSFTYSLIPSPMYILPTLKVWHSIAIGSNFNLNNLTMKNPFVNPKYFVWIYASDGNVYSIIPFEKKEDAYKRRDLLQALSYTCSVERELPCEWTEIGVSIHV